MTKTLMVRLAAGVLVSLGAFVAYTQSPQAPAQLNLQKIKDDLYMIEGDGGNVAIYTTNEGVILIDDKFERDFADIMAKVKSVSDKPLKYVINTHQHGDHTGSNEKLLPIAEIIAHKNARANMEKNKQPGLMRIVSAMSRTCFWAARKFACNITAAATPMAMLWFIFRRSDWSTPAICLCRALLSIDYANGGSAGEWSETLDGAFKLDFDTVIPGHGPVSKKADLTKFRDKMQDLTTRVSGMVRKGQSKDEISKMLVSDLGWPQASATRAVDGMMNEFKR